MRQWAARFPGSRARRSVLLTSAFLLLVMVFFVGELVWRYGWAYGELEQIEPRHARLAGLLSKTEQLKLAQVAIEADLGARAYPVHVGADRIGTELQQRLRRMAEAVGMSVANSQILPVRQEGPLEDVQVVITLEGSSQSLRNLLVKLESERPALHVAAAVLQPSSARGSGRLLARLTISALHLIP